LPGLALRSGAGCPRISSPEGLSHKEKTANCLPPPGRGRKKLALNLVLNIISVLFQWVEVFYIRGR
jgi:hypothetical protein